MGKKRFEARGFADEWAVRREKRLAKQAKLDAKKKAQKAASSYIRTFKHNSPQNKRGFFLVRKAVNPKAHSFILDGNAVEVFEVIIFVFEGENSAVITIGVCS